MIRNLKKLILIASTGAAFQLIGGEGCWRFLGDLTTDLLFLNLHPDLV